MQRFYFDLTDRGDVFGDPDGTELASLDDARREALRTLAGIIRDEFPTRQRGDIGINVRDEAGQIQLKAPLSIRIEQGVGCEPIVSSGRALDLEQHRRLRVRRI